MRIYEVVVSGRINSVWAYSKTMVTVKVKANYSLEARYRAVNDFCKHILNPKVVSCKEIKF